MRIDQQEVFEYEHQVADGLRQVGVLLLDVVQDFAAGRGIQPVQHFRHGAHAAVGFAAEFAQGLQLLPDHAAILRMISGEIWSRLAMRMRHIGAQPRRQRGQQRGRL